jgi:hypothetical protein
MKFENQYADVPKDQILRTTVEIPLTVTAQIKAIEPKTGVLQTTISILLTKLTDELTRIKLQPGDRQAYQHALANCTLCLDGGSGSTAAVAPAGKKSARPGKTPSGNDRRGAVSVARTPARAQESHDVAVAPNGGAGKEVVG